jgi:KaiC/GvpD/RAD55 family RecA-like ATPase
VSRQILASQSSPTTSIKGISLITSVSRALWQLAVTADVVGNHHGNPKRDPYRHASQSTLNEQVQHIEPGASAVDLEEILALMEKRKVCWRKDGDITYRLLAHNPVALAQQLLHGTRPDHDLRYFVWRSIREHYRFGQSAAIAHYIHILANSLNDLMSGDGSKANATAPGSRAFSAHALTEVVISLGRRVSENFATPLRAIDFFLECCRAVNYVRLSDRIGRLDIRAQEIDAEFLLCQLFGIPTSMTGLDELFGGGGLMLSEDISESSPSRLGGRAVLTVGPSGTGKSLLALQMAVEVARKGGAAWYMPMEQSAEECLYSMEALGCLPDGIPVRVATTVPQAINLLDEKNRDPERGALILIRTIKELFTDFAVAFEENAKSMACYPLRLIIVDPISSVIRGQANPDLRMQMLAMFESIKLAGTNIWLVSEENDQLSISIEQSISDTVLRLASEKIHGYSRRSIEITKSRLQREQRGLHSFAIGSKRGFTVYPSPAAVRSKLQKRRIRKPETLVAFGFPAIDAQLGAESLFSGDVIVLQGPSGCGKTSTAMDFVMSADLPRSKHSLDTALLITNVESAVSLERELTSAYLNRRAGSNFVRRPQDIRVVGLPGGFVQPGYVLQRLENEFEAAGFHHLSIARIVFDNVARMELGCPFIAGDPTFGDTLVDLIRKHGTTSLFICREKIRKGVPTLQQAILDNADCLIELSIEASAPAIQVKKSRGGHHRVGRVPLGVSYNSKAAAPEIQ